MAYINLATQRQIREQWQVGVLTKLRPDMKLPHRFEPGPEAAGHQGQSLAWLGYEARDQLHWFGVTQAGPLCDCCWEQNTCPRPFAHAPAEHEIWFGPVPLSSRVAQHLLARPRSWVEACQSCEKNQPGLKAMFFNSLRPTWTMGLLADAVARLRAHARLKQPQTPNLLRELMPTQLALERPSTDQDDV